MAGNQAWEMITKIANGLADLVARVAAIEKLTGGIPALFAPPDVSTPTGRGKLLGTLTRGAIGSVQSADMELYRQVADGSWEATGITAKVYEDGFLVATSIPIDTLIRWEKSGQKRYYAGHRCT